MVKVSGSLKLVTGNPATVSQVWLRAPHGRTQSGAYVTEAPDTIQVTGGAVSFDVLPGALVMTLASHGAPMQTVKLLVPDKDTVTLAECIEAAGLATDGTRSALERLAFEVQAELGQVPALVSDALAQDSTIIDAVKQVSAIEVDTTTGTHITVDGVTIFGDTGTRVLTSWDVDGNITYGTLPDGIAPMPDRYGGIYIRRVGQRVTWSIICAVATIAAPSIPIPEGFRVTHEPYPYTNLTPIRGRGPIIANVGSSRLFLAGFTVGENMTNTSSSYGSMVVWDCTQSWPKSLPGIPA